MELLLQIFIFLPLVGFVISLFFNNTQEKLISGLAYTSVGFQLIGIFAFNIYWLLQNAPVINLKHFVFFKENDIEIFLDFYFDKTTAVFSLLGALITFLVLVFSKYYLHRDSGYKRFFNTILLFFFAFNITVFAGNFETLFIGWEFLGITSFLLIAFYRDRYLPVKNALKTISLYRLGDICLILALWISHHIWHENITFLKLDDAALVATHISEHHSSVLFLLSMIVVAATIKSAQFPFSSWLPRAMEGPTTSSAVFYGSLAVHLGVFLLLRTYHYWDTVWPIKIAIIAIGVLTTVIATLIARVQSTVKTQIAYASIAQIGLMFIEVALGWHILVLVHLSGNALLRTYQLLVSPSVLGYMIHDQFFNFVPKEHKLSNSFASKISNSIYLLSLKEWNMDAFLKKVLWNPFKYIGQIFQFVSNTIGIVICGLIFVSGLLLFYFDDHIPKQIDEYLHLFFAFVGMILILLSFVEKKSPIKAWILIILSQLYVVLSVALLNDKYEYVEILLYVSSLFIAAIIGTTILIQIKNKETDLNLNDFYGHIYQYPKLGTWFLIACLAFVGLPFTPSFIGLDLMYSHVDHEEYMLIAFITVSFLVLELAVLRIYARVFLGPQKKQTHPIAYRSS
jgi:NADH:ubiquinone oxidoreductase subunit 5 (subunit L)/multisubunit Na+/H+ antiporter MnhA subunit